MRNRFSECQDTRINYKFLRQKWFVLLILIHGWNIDKIKYRAFSIYYLTILNRTHFLGILYECFCPHLSGLFDLDCFLADLNEFLLFLALLESWIFKSFIPNYLKRKFNQMKSTIQTRTMLHRSSLNIHRWMWDHIFLKIDKRL